MQVIKRPDLGRELAQETLRRAFSKHRLPLTMEELASLCARETRPRILSGYLRWQREEINCILAHVLLTNVEPLVAEFLRRHYGEERSIRYLSLRLPASERQLYSLHERFLQRLSSLLFYRPSMAEAYFPMVIVNLLAVLDVRLGTFALRAEIPVAEGWLTALYDARHRARELLSFMDSFLGQTPKNDVYHRIVCCKLAAPFTTAEELAARVQETSASSVHVYLRQYQGQVASILGIAVAGEGLPES